MATSHRSRGTCPLGEGKAHSHVTTAAVEAISGTEAFERSPAQACEAERPEDEGAHADREPQCERHRAQQDHEKGERGPEEEAQSGTGAFASPAPERAQCQGEGRTDGWREVDGPGRDRRVGRHDPESIGSGEQ
jgi:hypothetical protein